MEEVQGTDTKQNQSSIERSDETAYSNEELNKSETESIDELALQLENISLPSDQVLNELSMNGIVRYIIEHKCKNIVTMVGAGISTAAGIPDFRSPVTGVYHNLKKFKLPYLQAIFELKYFVKNPEPFYQLAQDLLPGEYRPTKSHYFIKLLETKGILLRHYSQNIDSLDRMAGISEEKLIEAHGTFYKSHCLNCRHEYGLEWLQRQMARKRIPHCYHCNGLVKPDIIFFGENLPRRFYQNITPDFQKCDLLIIMGSSLEVEPFASLALRPSENCPRLLINLVEVGGNIGFQYGKASNKRDVFYQGECDNGCQLLAEKLGWEDDLAKLMNGDSETKHSSVKGMAETQC